MSSSLMADALPRTTIITLNCSGRCEAEVATLVVVVSLRIRLHEVRDEFDTIDAVSSKRFCDERVIG